MTAAGNLAIAAAGAIVEGAALIGGAIYAERRVRRQRRRPPVRAVATVARPEVTTGRKELTS